MYSSRRHFRATATQAGLATNPYATTPAKAGNSVHESGYAVDIGWSSLTDAQQDEVLNNADILGVSTGEVTSTSRIRYTFFTNPDIERNT